MRSSASQTPRDSIGSHRQLPALFAPEQSITFGDTSPHSQATCWRGVLGNQALILLWVCLHCSHSRENSLLCELAHAEVHAAAVEQLLVCRHPWVILLFACGQVCHL